MKFFSVIAVTGLLLFSSIAISTPTTSGPDIKLHNLCLYPTILVTPASKTAYGSGVIVRSVKIAEGEYRNVFLTCSHVADLNEPYIVKVFEYENWSTLKTSKSYPCFFYARDEKTDLAIGVFASKESLAAASIDFDTRLYIGSNVFGIGCGLGDVPRLDDGKVTAVRVNIGSMLNNIRTNAYTVPGDSGSPLFHDYKVVGIRKAIRLWQGNPMFAMSYSTPVESLMIWSQNNGEAFHFVWRERALPQMPFHRLKYEHVS